MICFLKFPFIHIRHLPASGQGAGAALRNLCFRAPRIQPHRSRCQRLALTCLKELGRLGRVVFRKLAHPTHDVASVEDYVLVTEDKPSIVMLIQEALEGAAATFCVGYD